MSLRRSSSERNGSIVRRMQNAPRRSSSDAGPSLSEKFIHQMFRSGYRQIHSSAAPPVSHLRNNMVRTSKYSVLSWAPKSLMLQFRRTANLYFLVISVLTALPFSPKNPWSMAGTFSAVLIFTMCKEAYEDYLRHQQDNKVNQSQALVYSKGAFEQTQWQHIQVGNIIKVCEGGFFPADLICLASSDPTGMLFVNTMNLDGETNLKEKLAVETTRGLSEDTLRTFHCEICCEEPSPALCSLSCSLKANGVRWEPVKLPQLLLRGAQLKNTQYVFGVVIYTGTDTKIVQNSKAAPSKTSRVLKQMNRALYTVFLLQAAICIVFSVLYSDWVASHSDSHSYLELSTDHYTNNFFIQLISFWVAYSHLIPISLYVTLELVKLGMGYLVSQDLDMYYAPDDRAALSRTSDLIEELGQVQFVFSDKTGTLTCNVMEFKKCAIHSQVYEDQDDLANSKALLTASSEENSLADCFLLSLALCHTVFPVEKESGEVTYCAASPDELSLVTSIAKLGYELVSRTQNSLTIRHRGELRTWELLEEIPFSSERKRMSVIVKEAGRKFPQIITKGADQVVVPLLNGDSSTLKPLFAALKGFSEEGLRTLVVGSRELEYPEYHPWLAKWRELNLAQSTHTQDVLDAHATLLESHLELLGATAVEDKLQEEVPETIKFILSAGIKFWVLTGDKQETAIEIGRSCGLIARNMRVLNLSSENRESFLRSVETEYSQNTAGDQFCLVIDGVTLT